MDPIKKTTNSKKRASGKVLKASAVVAAAPKKATPAPAPVVAALNRKPSVKPASGVTPEQRFKMIEQAAYFRAEKHGFQVDPAANWLAAEAEVSAILAKRARK